MAQDIKAASIYAEVDFRLSGQTMNNLNRFEKRLDTIRRKLANLSTGKFNINANVSGRLSGGSGGGGIGMSGVGGLGALAGSTNMLKLVERIRYMAAIAESKRTTLENKIRATDLVPKEKVAEIRERFGQIAKDFQLGKLLRVEFETQSRQLGRELADIQKKAKDALKPEKFSSDINKGWVSQLARVAKAQSQMTRNVDVKRDQFERGALNLGNLKPDQINRYRERFNALVRDYERAPWAVNKFRTEVAALDREMRRANATTSFWQRSMRSFKSDLSALGERWYMVAAAGAAGMFHLGKEMDKTNVLFTTAFGPEAQKEMAFLKAESDRLGISLLGNARAYSKIAYSLKLLGLEGAEAKKVFSAFSEASLAFGMSTDDLSRAFKAIEQMYSCPDGLATSHGDMCRLAA